MKNLLYYEFVPEYNLMLFLKDLAICYGAIIGIIVCCFLIQLAVTYLIVEIAIYIIFSILFIIEIIWFKNLNEYLDS